MPGQTPGDIVIRFTQPKSGPMVTTGDQRDDHQHDQCDRDSPERLHTARYLNVSRPQAYALVRSGELPAIKLGGRGVWRRDSRCRMWHLPAPRPSRLQESGAT